MFLAGLYTIPKIWRQPKCPALDEWIKKTVVHLYNGILLRHKKGNLTFCDSIDGPGEHYAKRNKPVRERQVPYDFTHMCNLMNK